MDFLELTSSEELLLFEAVSNVSSDVPIVQSEPTRTVVNTTRHVEHKMSTVLADKTNFCGQTIFIFKMLMNQFNYFILISLSQNFESTKMCIPKLLLGNKTVI
jgi:actin-related protein